MCEAVSHAESASGREQSTGGGQMHHVLPVCQHLSEAGGHTVGEARRTAGNHRNVSVGGSNDRIDKAAGA